MKLHPIAKISHGVSVNKPKWAVTIKGARGVSQRTPVVFSTGVLLTFNHGLGGNYLGTLLCIDAATGSEIWRFDSDHTLNQPVIDEDNSIYITCFNGTAYRLDNHGNVLWESTPSKSNTCEPVICGNAIVYPEIHGGATRTWGLSKQDGSVSWSYENGGHSYSLASNSEVVVHSTVRGAMDHKEINLLCLNASDGKLIWKVARQEYIFRPTIDGGQIFVGGRGCVLCFSLRAGEVLAEYKLAEGDAVIQAPIVTPAGVIFCSEEGEVISLGLTSKRQGLLRKEAYTFEVNWKINVGAKIEAEVILNEGRVHVLCESGNIVTISVNDGTEISRIEVPRFERGFGLSVLGKDFIVAASRESFRIPG